MITSKIVNAVASASVAVTAAGVVLVSVFFALYTLLSGFVGPTASSAIIIAVIAAALAVLGVLMLGRVKSPKEAPAEPVEPPNGRDRLFGLARERPVMAAGAAVAAGLIAWRNPRLAGSFMRFFEPSED